MIDLNNLSFCRFELELQSIVHNVEWFGETVITVFLDQPHVFVIKDCNSELGRLKLDRRIELNDSFESIERRLKRSVLISVALGGREGVATANFSTLFIREGGHRVWNHPIVGSYRCQGIDGCRIRLKCCLSSENDCTEQIEVQENAVENESSQQRNPLRQIDNNRHFGSISKSYKEKQRVQRDRKSIEDINAVFDEVKEEWRNKQNREFKL